MTDELACDREFTVTVAGAQKQVLVEWFKPWLSPQGWRCDMAIHGLDPQLIGTYTVGLDSTQALLLGMSHVTRLLEDKYSGSYWVEPGAGLGLPDLSFDR